MSFAGPPRPLGLSCGRLVLRRSADGAPLVRLSAGVTVGELAQYVTDHAARLSCSEVQSIGLMTVGDGRSASPTMRHAYPDSGYRLRVYGRWACRRVL